MYINIFTSIENNSKINVYQGYTSSDSVMIGFCRRFGLSDVDTGYNKV